jgi:hypothetical protein
MHSHESNNNADDIRRRLVGAMVDFEESMLNLGPYATFQWMAQHYRGLSESYAVKNMFHEAELFAEIASEYEASAEEHKPFVTIPPRTESPN